MINCKIELTLSWSKNCIISEISRTAAVSANPPNLARAEMSTTSALFQINSAKLHVSVATLSINDNIKFLENLKQGFKRTISGNKYRPEIITQPKNNNLDYMIHSTFRNINRLFVLPFKGGENDPTRNSFDKNYRPLVKINDFNTLTDTKPFLDQLVQTQKRMKNLSKCQETTIIEQETY